MIKNYTSSVPMLTSISRIEYRLAKAGALHIAKSYKNEMPVGMMFQLDNGKGIPLTFKLPAKTDKVFEWLRYQRKRPPTKSQLAQLEQQANRTAWKILSDWIDIQISMIEIGHTEAMQVFLPYAYDVNEDKTLYEKIKETNFKMLTAGE